jgi:Rps23 Pro-64 3,4-dihydroxylase Tpa1-like proline 4-hydroxylase
VDHPRRSSDVFWKFQQFEDDHAACTSFTSTHDPDYSGSSAVDKVEAVKISLNGVASSLNLSGLEGTLPTLTAEFNAATPYRHVVIDNFLSDETARRAAESFPPFEQMQRHHVGLVENRAIEMRFERIDPVYSQIFADLTSDRFMKCLRTLSSVSDLSFDAKFNGAGLHQARDGGFQNIHADSNRHPGNGLFQRLNILIYLNSTWRSEWGGGLELWAQDLSRCEKTILPLFNRCVIFEVHDRAYHGFARLSLRGDVTRKSVTCWYFSETPSPLQATKPHDVLFQLTPNDSLSTRMKHYARLARLRLPKRVSRLIDVARNNFPKP